MVFCNMNRGIYNAGENYVTILILIDGFLQLMKVKIIVYKQKSHNPYFNRWFSAISGSKFIKKH